VPDFVGDDGWPKGSRGAATAPGLYFLGIPFTFGFTSMLIAGAGRDARHVVDRIAERARAARGGRAVERATAAS
jgi:putative flavoprotein involved in K+ transport